MGGKSDKQTTTQENDPWKPAQGALKDILNQAGGLYSKGTEYAPFNTVTPFSGQTEDALGGIEGRARQGNQLYGQGQAGLAGGLEQLQRTAGGEYLNNNPHLSTMFNAMKGDVQDSVNSQFSQYGRTGSPAHAGVMTQQLGNLGAQIYGQDYARERQNQLSAAGQMPSYTSAIPGYQQAGYNDLNTLAGVGAAREGKANETLQDMLNRWNFKQESPWQNLGRYAGIATGVGGMGGTGTQTQEVQTSPLSQLVGLLSAAGGAAKDAGSAYASFSDRNGKTNIEPMDDDKALNAINSIPSFTYRYKAGVADNGAQGRIGPMAQDWAEEFGGDGKSIPMPQMIGAMFSAIKAISRRLDALEAK
jgi:hypothetical protein